MSQLAAIKNTCHDQSLMSIAGHRNVPHPTATNAVLHNLINQKSVFTVPSMSHFSQLAVASKGLSARFNSLIYGY